MDAAPMTFDPRVTEEGDNRPHFRSLLRENWVSVMTDCLVFGSFGMGVAILGPTLFDLGCQTSASLRELNWVFFVQLLMTLVGSLSAGCLAQRFIPVHVLMLIGMTGLPFTMLLVPACTEFAELLLNLMLMGWCMGCIDCVANLRMIIRFGTNVSPFLQAMHFCYGLGAFISPMIAAMFTLDVDCSHPVNGKVTIDNFENTSNSSQPQVTTQVSVSRAQHLSHSERAFFILASIQFFFTAIVIVVIILEKKRVISSGVTVSQSTSMMSVLSPTSDEQDLRDISGQTYCFCFGTRETVVVILITSASLFLYDGLQSSYADYIYSFAIKNVKGLQKGEGAYLNACFWGTFALGRLIAIPCATRLTAAFMLTCNLGGCAFALLVTLIFRGNHVVTYFGTCVLGLFLSSMSPTIMSLTELFIDINAPIASCLVVSAALGETLCPVIVGNLFVASGPPSFLIFCTVLALLSGILYGAVYFYGKNTPKYRGLKSDSFVWITKFRKQREETNPFKPISVKYYSQKDRDKTQTVEGEIEFPNNMAEDGDLYNSPYSPG
ncbi:major facilitator superfamily domain-containing protein 4A-like isoform X1 [Ostrea edulis]|uniref:major facilitator superfamily domain-containing protein 4A-like isoform X1 n=1 Tax=Ostrea edulis TaxID=37623 RepID=UPI0024AEFEBC|nr:major facilitator superfamily domain-containing protein 4A-like isoform X1 [Ostrea edulis]